MDAELLPDEVVALVGGALALFLLGVIAVGVWKR